MTQIVHTSLEPIWPHEAFTLMLSWLLAEESPKEWVEAPLLPATIRPELAEKIGDRFMPLEAYLRAVRRDALAHLETLDGRWKDWIGIQRERAEPEEAPWLGHVFILLGSLEPEEITGEKLALAANDAVRYFAAAEREPGEKNAELPMEQLIGLVSEMPIEDAQRMQVIRFYGQLEENAKDLRQMAEAIVSIMKQHFSVLQPLYTKMAKELREDPQLLLHWANRLTSDEMQEKAEGQYHAHISLVLHRALNLYQLEGPLRIGTHMAVGMLFIELEEETLQDMYSAEWIQKRLKALSDPTRFEIIRLLSKRPMYVQELVDALDLKAATLTHHLSILRWNLLVQLETRGRRNYYHLSRESIRELTEGLLQITGEKNEN